MWYYSYFPTEPNAELPMYLYSIGMHDTQPLLVRPEGHRHDQFFYNTTGSGTILIYGQKYNIPEKSSFFIPAHVPHEYYPNTDIWDIRWFVPCGKGLRALYKHINLKFGIYPLSDARNLDSLLNSMRSELMYNDINGNLFASAHINEFILEFAVQSGLLHREISYPEQNMNPYSRHMRIIKDYIDSHYMQPISMDELCALEGLTPQHICRIFKQCVRMRPSEYILDVRISHAKEMLLHTSHSISEIAYWCGFENNNYFWKKFRDITGYAPGEYRKLSSAQNY